MTMVVAHADALPVIRVDQIAREENAQRWLVESLWGEFSVGVIGGAPKCAKTWLGLDLVGPGRLRAAFSGRTRPAAEMVDEVRV